MKITGTCIVVITILSKNTQLNGSCKHIIPIQRTLYRSYHIVLALCTYGKCEEPRSPALQANSLPAEPPGKSKNTGVGGLCLQRIFPTQTLSQRLLHCRRILHQLAELPRKPQKNYVGPLIYARNLVLKHLTTIMPLLRLSK